MAKGRRRKTEGLSVSVPVETAPRSPADARAEERLARQQERAAARRRQEMTAQVRLWSVVGALVIVVAGGVFWWLSQPPQPPPQGSSVPIVGWDHIDPSSKATDYTTVPPTSGQHYPTWAKDGVHNEPIQDEFQVHNLEHGQILVQYTCDDCPELATKLKGFVARYPKWVIVAPYPDPRVGAKIVLTAWGRIDAFDEYDEVRIRAFIESYKNKGRENVIME